jgi:hypothetical protein
VDGRRMGLYSAANAEEGREEEEKMEKEIEGDF